MVYSQIHSLSDHDVTIFPPLLFTQWRSTRRQSWVTLTSAPTWTPSTTSVTFSWRMSWKRLSQEGEWRWGRRTTRTRCSCCPRYPGKAAISVWWQTKTLLYHDVILLGVHDVYVVFVCRRACLVRLGDTHTSKCRPDRETAFTSGKTYQLRQQTWHSSQFDHIYWNKCTWFFNLLPASDMRYAPSTTRGHQPLPGQLYGFPNCINLPLKQIVMNPFPCLQDKYDPAYNLQQPVMLMLKSSQKYFVQDRSIVAPDMIY